MNLTIKYANELPTLVVTSKHPQKLCELPQTNIHLLLFWPFYSINVQHYHQNLMNITIKYVNELPHISGN